MRLARHVTVTALVAGATSLIACTSILGDFEVGTGSTQDGGATKDASTGDGGGACATDCSKLANVATATCGSDGKCVIATCKPNFGDCDKDASNGCELSLTTQDHCGTCTTTCSGNTPLCSSSSDGGAAACVSGCGATQTRCGSSCVDTQTDPNNCGSCNRLCATKPNATTTCVGGSCGSTCNQGFHSCNSTCVSNNDVNSCGNSCSPCANVPFGTATCDGTTCGGKCNQGFHMCGSSCKDDTSTSSCGQSCNPCQAPQNGSPTCNGVSCDFTCNNPFVKCQTACVDAKNDPNNCGSCGNVCSGQQSACINGACSCPQQKPTMCGGVCTNTQNDADNCGGCAHSCQGGTCSQGVCQPLQLWSGNPNDGGIGVNTTDVFFSDGSGKVLHRVSNVGLNHVALATLPSWAGPVHFDTNLSLVFVADSSSNKLYAYSTSGSLASGYPLSSGGAANGYGTPGAILTAVNQPVVWWGDDSTLATQSSDIWRSNLSSPSATISTKAVGGGKGLWALAFDQANMQVVAAVVGANAIKGCAAAPQDAGAPCQSMATVAAPTGVRVVGNTVLFVARGVNGNGGLYSFHTNFQSLPQALATGNNVAPLNGGMTADATTVYWGGNGSGHIYACAATGCNQTPKDLTPNNAFNVYALANDDKSVYWIGSSGVWKVAK